MMVNINLLCHQHLKKLTNSTDTDVIKQDKNNFPLSLYATNLWNTKAIRVAHCLNTFIKMNEKKNIHAVWSGVPDWIQNKPHSDLISKNGLLQVSLFTSFLQIYSNIEVYTSHYLGSWAPGIYPYTGTPPLLKLRASNCTSSDWWSDGKCGWGHPMILFSLTYCWLTEPSTPTGTSSSDVK